jgi:hypothetical protein
LMDVDKLKEKASSRKAEKVEKIGWHCQYCDKTFTLETAFMNHVCQERTRFEELRSPVGQAAYAYYCEWMTAYKRKAPNIDTFAISRYYSSFVKFAQHAVDLSFPNPIHFIKLMVEKDISPMLWRRDQCYSIYLEWIDKTLDPLDQVQISIETLIDIAGKEGVELTSVFTHLGEKRITELIRLRKLSPWFLFCSTAFGDFLRANPVEDLQAMMAIINPAYWSAKLDANDAVVQEIKEINAQIGI